MFFENLIYGFLQKNQVLTFKQKKRLKLDEIVNKKLILFSFTHELLNEDKRSNISNFCKILYFYFTVVISIKP